MNVNVTNPAPQVSQQPVNVNVTTPNGKTQTAEVQPIMVNVPQPAPAQIPPINITLQMPPQAVTPVAIATPVEEKKETNVVAPVEPVLPPVEEEEEEIVVEPRDWNVSCPNCSKSLKVSDKSVYHRCPSCSKVFELRKNTKNVPD